jgi:hypothetical protein
MHLRKAPIALALSFLSLPKVAAGAWHRILMHLRESREAHIRLTTSDRPIARPEMTEEVNVLMDDVHFSAHSGARKRPLLVANLVGSASFWEDVSLAFDPTAGKFFRIGFARGCDE